MKCAFGTLTVMTAALLTNSVSLAAAGCGHPPKAALAAASDAGIAISSQQKAEKAMKDKNGQKSGQKKCPPEHKKAGHC